MAVRTKVLVLLVGVVVFLAGATATSIFVRGRAAEALAGAAERDVRLLAAATHVTAAHLEQAIRLERAVRHARDRGHSPEAQEAYERAHGEYEAYSAGIWRRLREAREAAEREPAASDEGAAARLALLERIDAAHNAYAEEARHAFALLDAGRLRAARTQVRTISRDEDLFQHALGELLLQASASIENASSRARSDWRFATWVVAILTALCFGVMIAVFAMVVRLVSTLRVLDGLLPICSHCKKIRDAGGYWNQLEAYLHHHAGAAFTHGICADCQTRMRAQLASGRAVAIAAVDGAGI